MKLPQTWVSAGLLIALLSPLAALGQTPQPAVIMKMTGDVKVLLTDGQVVPASLEMVLKNGDTVRTGPAASVLLKLGEGNTVALQENSELRIGTPPPKPAEQGASKPPPSLTLLGGALLGRLKNVPQGKVSIGTSTSMAGIEGTTFAITASNGGGESSVAVMEGVVSVESRGDAGRSAVVGARKMTRVSEWSKTVLKATGAGVPTGRYKPIPVYRDETQIYVVRARGVGKTSDEAARNARETLSGRILRAKVAPEMTVADWLVGKDDAYARLAAFVGAAAVRPATVLPDGAVEVIAEAGISDLDRVLEQRVPIFEGAVVTIDELKYSLYFGARERLTAERAATVDAQRKLLETIQGVQITSDSTVEDFALKNDVIKSRVEGVLRGAETLNTQYFSDGTVEVTMGIRGPALVEEINRAAQKDLLGRNYLAKPTTMDLPAYEELRKFGAAEN